MYTAGHAHSVRRMKMPRFRRSQEVQKQRVHVAFILIRRRFDGVVIHSQAHIYEEKGPET
jgi:hypothetical protein